MKRLTIAMLVVLGLAGTASSASAAGITFGTPPPASVIVVRNGLEWIWAAPCASVVPSCGAPTLMFGFVVPTDSQWLASFTSLTDLQNAFTVPGQLCGSPWMSSFHSHCDSSDLLTGYVWHSPFVLDAEHHDNPAAEGFLVRGAVAAVPEPATFGLMAIGLGLLAVRARRRKA